MSCSFSEWLASTVSSPATIHGVIAFPLRAMLEAMKPHPALKENERRCFLISA